MTEKKTKLFVNQSIDADVERLVIAHELVLQAMISYMERIEPKFLVALMNRFANAIQITRAKYSHRDSKDSTGEFLHAIKRLRDTLLSLSPPHQRTVSGSPCITAANDREVVVTVPPKSNRICVSEKNGLWQVKVDGESFVDCRQRDDAMTAVEMLEPCLR